MRHMAPNSNQAADDGDDRPDHEGEARGDPLAIGLGRCPTRREMSGAPADSEVGAGRGRFAAGAPPPLAIGRRPRRRRRGQPFGASNCRPGTRTVYGPRPALCRRQPAVDREPAQGYDGIRRTTKKPRWPSRRAVLSSTPHFVTRRSPALAWFKSITRIPSSGWRVAPGRFLGGPGNLRVSLNGDRPDELVAVVNAVTKAYVSEVVNKEENRRPQSAGATQGTLPRLRVGTPEQDADAQAFPRLPYRPMRRHSTSSTAFSSNNWKRASRNCWMPSSSWKSPGGAGSAGGQKAAWRRSTSRRPVRQADRAGRRRPAATGRHPQGGIADGRRPGGARARFAAGESAGVRQGPGREVESSRRLASLSKELRRKMRNQATRAGAHQVEVRMALIGDQADILSARRRAQGRRGKTWASEWRDSQGRD